MGTRRTEIERHRSEEEIDELLRATEDDHRLRRIGFVKNLYRGDTIPEAADREGRSPATGTRWASAWNEGGFEELMPNFGGGRPAKLDDGEKEELLDQLREGQPWRIQAIRRLLADEFDVEYHPNYLSTFLRNLGLSVTESPVKPADRPGQRATAGDGDDGEVSDETETSHGPHERETGRRWIVDGDD
ncbi:IS630-type transposase ISHwa7 [Halococcus thailandensis JCM 13552]|uniref:IS630-type transposase ISHwa7 n=1 Tax=Halococcus thailandensis JCM 13552 TaxID=1227457 RepID=M0MV74_9EURY|nr:IS630 family transposase [Halococcus thailandensis]EMA49642.1 IS630-type transposase ISHwa7 [Halococcus thailandensis JCM 13552]